MCLTDKHAFEEGWVRRPNATRLLTQRPLLNEAAPRQLGRLLTWLLTANALTCIGMRETCIRFQGSPRQAIAYLLADTDISDSDLNEIRRMIDSRKQRQRKGTEQ